MSTSLRVSPSVHGYRFDTALRKKAVANIYESTDQESLQKLFKNSGDKKAEERARIILDTDQDLEEKTRALMALKQRTKDKLFQFLKLQKYSIKVHWTIQGKGDGRKAIFKEQDWVCEILTNVIFSTTMEASGRTSEPEKLVISIQSNSTHCKKLPGVIKNSPNAKELVSATREPEKPTHEWKKPACLARNIPSALPGTELWDNDTSTQSDSIFSVNLRWKQNRTFSSTCLLISSFF